MVLENEEELLNPIFVIGCPRSGTSMLARIIALSDSVCYLEEMGFISRYFMLLMPIYEIKHIVKDKVSIITIIKRKIRYVQRLMQKRDLIQELTTQLFLHSKIESFDLKPSGRLVHQINDKLNKKDYELIDKLCEKYKKIIKRKDSFLQLFRIILMDFSILSEKDVVLEKSPDHVEYINTIRRIFPKAKIIHSIRKIEDVAASYIQPAFAPSKKNLNPVKHICKLHAKILVLDNTLSENKTDFYKSINYDYLLGNPLHAIENLFEYLNLKINDNIINKLKDVRKTRSKFNSLSQKDRLKINLYVKKFS